mgnify:CR=1 FL=1
MISNWEVIETNHMIEKKTVDVRTITIGISLLDCIDSDLNKLNEESVNNIDEYNEKNPKERLRHYLLIITDNELQNKDVNDKLVFILQVSNKIGFFMIFLTKDKGLLDIVYENYFDLQLHFKNSKSMEVSKQITPLECFLTYKGEIERITPVSLSNKEFEEFKALIKESGNSSYKFLQNVYSNHDLKNQNVAVGLAVSELVLGKQGVCRVHGGGFAGTIQAFVKNEAVKEYKETLDKVFGEGACAVLKVRKYGGMKVL